MNLEKKLKKYLTIKMKQVQLSSFCAPLNDFHQLFMLLFILIRTNGSLDYSEYAEILSSYFKKRFLERTIVHSVDKIKTLFFEDKFSIAQICDEFNNFEQTFRHAKIKTTVPVKTCANCTNKDELIECNPFTVTCYDYNSVTIQDIQQLSCKSCLSQYNCTYWSKSNSFEFQYGESIKSNFFLISRRTCFTKKFITMLLTLVYKNGLAIKSKLYFIYTYL